MGRYLSALEASGDSPLSSRCAKCAWHAQKASENYRSRRSIEDRLPHPLPYQNKILVVYSQGRLCFRVLEGETKVTYVMQTRQPLDSSTPVFLHFGAKTDLQK